MYYWARCHDLCVLNVFSFKPAFSPSSFILIKSFFSFLSLSAVKVVSSAYLRLLIFLLANLIPDCESSSLAFHMMYSFPNLETVSCSVSNSNCCFLTHIHVSQEAGKVVWYSHLFKNFPVCCDHTVRGFSIISEAVIGVFF